MVRIFNYVLSIFKIAIKKDGATKTERAAEANGAGAHSKKEATRRAGAQPAGTAATTAAAAATAAKQRLELGPVARHFADSK